MYSKYEVMEYCESEDVKFVRLAFCDLFGIQKNISILSTELERAFEHGISFDASAISGFGSSVKSDLFLFPDPSTLSVLPWRPFHGKVVRMFCDIRYPDGTPFEYDSRGILINAIKEAKKRGITLDFGAEFEFYLFKTDEDGNPTDVTFDNAGYFDVAPEDKGENVRREICLTLEEMDIPPESSYHEEGPGQNEIDFHYSDPLTAADNAVTCKSIVHTVAAKNGLFATFMPRPVKDKSGNGMHINISLNDKTKTDSFIAGILKHIGGLTAFLNSTRQSYERLGKDKAPMYVTWSEQNRSQLIRIPAEGLSRQRFELRSPDPMTNPYIAYALLIYAGLDGIDRDLKLCQPLDMNLYEADKEITDKLEKLPETFEDAIKAAKNSEIVSKWLPEGVCGYLSERNI